MAPTDGGEVPTEFPAGGEFRAVWKWRRQHKRIAQEHERRGEKLPRVHPEAGRRLRDGSDSITWAGHASVIHRLDGHTVLSDPVWSRKIAWGIVKRLTPPAPDWKDVPTPEIIAISHNHYDHMDADTLKRARRATLCVPRGVGAWFRRRRFKNVHEFEWWQTKDLEGLKLTFVPSKHFSGRMPWDRDKSLFGGWVIEGQRSRVYHAGDSGYFAGFQEIGARFPRLDVACLPIGAYLPRWFMRRYHVDPGEATQAFLDVGARQFLPIHWGTFRLSDEAMDDPPRETRRAFEERGLDLQRLWIPDLGQTLPVAPPD